MLTLLDTDTLSLHLKGQPQVMANVQAYAQAHGVIHFSLITHYEILNGLFYKDARQQLGRYQTLLHDSRLLPLTPESVRLAARISAQLRIAGQPIGHTDRLIAGVALANGMQPATSNTRHFSRIDGLQLVNWAHYPPATAAAGVFSGYLSVLPVGRTGGATGRRAATHH